MKQCSVCREAKQRDEFYVDRSRPSGLTYACKRCHSKRTSSPVALARRRAYSTSTKGRRSWYSSHIRRAYGMTVTDWEEMLIKQSGRCAICSTPMTKVCVDHCHDTGVVRALLCDRCNRVEGLLHSDPNVAFAMYEYIVGHAAVKA